MDKNEIKAFCDNIRQLRKSNKLSKKEMAKKLEIGVGSLTMIENGKIPPRLRCTIIFHIHEHFGIFPSQLLEPIENLSL